MVVAGDDFEEKRLYRRDNSSGSGSGSVVTIRKADENRSSDKDKVDDSGVVLGTTNEMNGGSDVGQGPRPRTNTQDSPNNAALVVSPVPLPSNSPSTSPEDTTPTSTRVPPSPPSVPSSSYVTQYSEPVVIPPGHVWLAGDPDFTITLH